MGPPDDFATAPIKSAIDLVKAVVEALHLNPTEDKANPRAGPLVIIGRFYISLTLILAAVTSASAIIDWKAPQVSPTVAVMRLLLVFCILAGLVMGSSLLLVLLGRHTLFLFNPAELSQEALQQLIGATPAKEDLEKGTDPNHNPAPTVVGVSSPSPP
jgi:hypothetical protein